MKRGLACVPSAAIVLFLRRELGIGPTLLLAAVASALGHVLTAGVSRKGIRWAAPAVAVFYALQCLFGGPIWSPVALAWAMFMSATFVLSESEAEALVVPTVVLPGSLGSPSLFLVSGVVGAWIGVFSVPLDWDLEWQVFPVASSIVCAVVSVAVGLLEGTRAALHVRRGLAQLLSVGE